MGERRGAGGGGVRGGENVLALAGCAFLWLSLLSQLSPVRGTFFFALSEVPFSQTIPVNFPIQLFIA